MSWILSKIRGTRPLLYWSPGPGEIFGLQTERRHPRLKKAAQLRSQAMHLNWVLLRGTAALNPVSEGPGVPLFGTMPHLRLFHPPVLRRSSVRCAGPNTRRSLPGITLRCAPRTPWYRTTAGGGEETTKLVNEVAVHRKYFSLTLFGSGISCRGSATASACATNSLASSRDLAHRSVKT